MEFYEVVKKRRSYRQYLSQMPKEESINRILEAARLGPTWANKQGMHYIIVKEPEKVKAIKKAVGQLKKFSDAPMFIIGLIKENGSGTGANGIKYFAVDFGICFEHLILAATAEDLATCWIGFFNEKKVKKVLEIPEEYRVLGLTPLGYPKKEKGEVKDRLPLEKIVHYDKF